MKSSILKKANKDVLLEWIYDNGNTSFEPYRIISNAKNQIRSFVSGETSISDNIETNQLVVSDPIRNKYIRINYSQQPYLSYSDFSGQITYDKLKVYFPSNFTFGEHQGFYIRAYTYDYSNKKFYDLSNFFFDINDSSRASDLSNFTPPVLYEDRVWDRFVEIDIPSVYHTSIQRFDGKSIDGTVNYNLTQGEGLSQTAPIFLEFQFISNIQILGSIKNYITTQKLITQFPQYPELASLGMIIQESIQGDYFEIYPKYNDTFQEFVNFIEDSKSLNKVYYLEYKIVVYEQNVRGKMNVLKVEENFNEYLDFRPIIKYSTSSAIIDVEMKLIDKVSGTIVVRKSAYGMKPDQVSKYALNMKRTKVREISKPKIYSKNNIGSYRIDQLGKSTMPENKVKVPVPVLSFIDGIACKSPQSINRTSTSNIDNYHFNGRLKIGIIPFDNIIKFFLAFKTKTSITPMDLTGCKELKLVFRNDESLIEFNQYIDSETSPNKGVCKFKIPESRYLDIKNMMKGGINVFYITTTNQQTRTTIYSGLYSTTQSQLDISEFDESNETRIDDNSSIIDDPETSSRQEVAIVTRKKIIVTPKGE